MRFAAPPPDIVSPTTDIAAATAAFAEQTDGFARETACFAEQTAAFARATACFAAPPPDIAAATDDIAAGASGFAEATACFAEQTAGFALGENEDVRENLRDRLVSYGAAKGKERLATNDTKKLCVNYNSPAVNGSWPRITLINTDYFAGAKWGFHGGAKGKERWPHFTRQAGTLICLSADEHK